MKCTLLKEINKCEYCELNTMTCNNPGNECAFKDVEDSGNEIPTPSKYVRKERWFEKYYKK